ncbi:hypothetical protein [Desulfofalx alkaliphila]|uniref:hypothetical protein n=1 Tax=Desulfofalx alkaliphila TaxID=105483 RepID=UPI0004E13924|nr:hypothetical protein [Desulfofalx alkaliphila]
MYLLLLFIAFALIIATEVPRLVRQDKYKELLVFSFLLAVGIGLSIAEILNFSLLNPTQISEWIFKPLGEVMVDFLSQ